MNKEFIPYEQSVELVKLGFDEPCIAGINVNSFELKMVNYDPELYLPTPLYQQAFRWFREKYDFTYSIGKTNIAVVHYGQTTQLLQDNDSYEAAELAAIKWFIETAKNK